MFDWTEFDVCPICSTPVEGHYVPKPLIPYGGCTSDVLDIFVMCPKCGCRSSVFKFDQESINQHQKLWNDRNAPDKIVRTQEKCSKCDRYLGEVGYQMIFTTNKTAPKKSSEETIRTVGWYCKHCIANMVHKEVLSSL